MGVGLEYNVPTSFRYVFKIPILSLSAISKKFLICWSLGVSLSYCLETEGSVLESTSSLWSVSGILKGVVCENSLVDVCLGSGV